MPNKNDGKVDKDLLLAVDDATKYPILTEEVTFPRPSAPPGVAGGGAPGGPALGQSVDVAIRQVLGWRPKAGDVKGFVGALNQAFSLKEVEGHTEVTWTPRTYTSQVQAEMGSITGAQASIYARARVAAEQTLPLLDGLYPLRPDFDPEDVASIRAIVKSEVNEIVNELGVEGGPRVTRVDQLFDLLGAVADAKRVEDVSGHLAMLLGRFGLESSYVNTIEQEQDLTNFIVLVDYLNSLRSSWEMLKPYFVLDDKKLPAFLGTQLVLLSRTLDVIVEGVQEVAFVMDSVFLGPAERQTILLKFGTQSEPMFFADLMGWVERFASEEGPRIIQDSGKDGVGAFSATVRRLHDLVVAALLTSWTPPGLQNPADPDVPDAYRATRVQSAISELAGDLGEAFDLATRVTRVPSPTIAAAVYTPDPFLPPPSTGPAKKSVSMNVYGTHFAPKPTVLLAPMPGTKTAEIKATRSHYINHAYLHALFSIPAGIAAGTSYSLVIANPDGGVAVLEDAFRIEGK